MRGVKAVADEIEVRLPTTAERTDAEIALAAKRAQEWDAFVPLPDVQVTVSKGWVTLHGEVQWQYQKRAAERTVRRLPGVRGVTNLITVRPRVKTSPEELKTRIKDALVRDAETDAEHITVEVDGDKVILKGTVRSWAEKDESGTSRLVRTGRHPRRQPHHHLPTAASLTSKRRSGHISVKPRPAPAQAQTLHE